MLYLRNFTKNNINNSAVTGNIYVEVVLNKFMNYWDTPGGVT